MRPASTAASRCSLASARRAATRSSTATPAPSATSASVWPPASASRSASTSMPSASAAASRPRPPGPRGPQPSAATSSVGVGGRRRGGRGVVLGLHGAGQAGTGEQAAERGPAEGGTRHHQPHPMLLFHDLLLSGPLGPRPTPDGCRRSGSSVRDGPGSNLGRASGSTGIGDRVSFSGVGTDRAKAERFLARTPLLRVPGRRGRHDPAGQRGARRASSASTSTSWWATARSGSCTPTTSNGRPATWPTPRPGTCRPRCGWPRGSGATPASTCPSRSSVPTCSASRGSRGSSSASGIRAASAPRATHGGGSRPCWPRPATSSRSSTQDGRLLWVNGPVEDLVGLPAEALVGLTLPQITNPEDQADLERWWRYVLSVPGTSPPVLGARRQADGSTRHLEARADNLLDHPEVRAVVVTIRDVGERVAAEQARADLAANETRLRALGAHSHELVTLMDRDGRLLWAGAGMRRLLGRDPDEMFGMPVSEVVHPDDLGRPGGLRDLARGPATHFDARLPPPPRRRQLAGLRHPGRRPPRRAHHRRLPGHRARHHRPGRHRGGQPPDGGRHRVVRCRRGGHGPCREGARLEPPGRGARRRHPRRRHRPAAAHRGAAPGRSGGRGPSLPPRRRHGHVRRHHGPDRPTGPRCCRSRRAPVTDASGTTTAFSFIAFDITAQRAMAAEREAHARRARALADLGQRAPVGRLARRRHGGRLRAGRGGDGPRPGARAALRRRGRLAPRWPRRSARAPARSPGPSRSTPVRGSRPSTTSAGRWSSSTSGARTGGVPRAFEELGILSGVLCTIDGGRTPIGWLSALDSRERRYDEAEVGFLQSIANVLATTVERNRASDELARRALHDELTGLPNRALLLDRLVAGHGPHRAPPRPGRPAVHRPRPVQAGQRHAGPPGRGPPAGRHRPTAARGRAGRRHRGAHRWRRVPGPDRGGRGDRRRPRPRRARRRSPSPSPSRSTATACT